MSRTPPNQQTAFGHHARDISSQLQVAVDEGLDQEGIKSRQGRRFHRRRKPAKQSDEGHHREKKFPLGCPINIPGRIPPRNIFSMVILETMAYKIKGRQGGKRRTSEPAPVSSPSEAFSVYPLASGTGMSKPPSASIVTPEAPVKEVKKAQIRAVTIAGPPRNCPTSDWKTWTSLFEAPPSARKYPARVNSGIVGREGLVTSR